MGSRSRSRLEYSGYGAFEAKKVSPNYRPGLVTGTDLHGYSFSTSGAPTGPNFSTKGSIYDGYEAFAEASFGDETAAWMKAAVQPQDYPHLPGVPLLNRDYRPRNAQIPARLLSDVDGGLPAEKDERFPVGEYGKYLERPAIPPEYTELYPEFFSTELIPPMYHPYMGNMDVMMARHYTGHPTLPVPPLYGADALDYAPPMPTAEYSEAELFGIERLLFGAGMPWWKWKTQSSSPLDMPSKATFREHEEGYAMFRGKLQDHLSHGNMDSWATASCADTLVDLSANDGIELAIRGDTKFYRCVLTSANTKIGSIEYVADIPAKTSSYKWRIVKLDWSKFQPCFKGGKITGVAVDQVPPMDPSSITSIGFGVGDRQWGGFVLEIDYIKAYCSPYA